MMAVPNPYGPVENFFRAWGRDAADRWVYVGLNHDETQELLRLQGAALEGNDLTIVNPFTHHGPDEQDRYLELHEKHEIARLQLCARESAAKRGLTEKPH